MKQSTIIITLIFFCVGLTAQQIDTFYLHHPLSKYDTIIYKRIFDYSEVDSLYYVRDYYPIGQIIREGHYSTFDKNVFEGLWCNYFSNTKEGEFTEWYENGQIKSKTNYLNGLRNGTHKYWYSNGNVESVRNFSNGQDHGEVTYWDTTGNFERVLLFIRGLNQNPKDTNYHYLAYTPKDYDNNLTTKYPLIIYLHGGTPRGNDLSKLYSYGIPEQIYHGREFPFIVISPQCPIHHRWSTDNWFENFYAEITKIYRIDTNRVYLTGVSLGASGTWYLAIKYPEIFAAIAPVSGFTHHIDFISENIDRIKDMPIWVFHGKIDKVVPFEDSEQIVKLLEDKNDNIKFTSKSDIGHWLHWFVYPENELYDWFMEQDKRLNNN